MAYKTMKKHSPVARGVKSLVGEKNFEKAHFLGEGVLKQSEAKHEAKKAAKTAEELAAQQRAMQATALAELDEEENRRIKKILTASRGTRNYRGGPMFRGRASNTAGASVSRTASAVPSGLSPASASMRAGGARGGLGRSLLD